MNKLSKIKSLILDDKEYIFKDIKTKIPKNLHYKNKKIYNNNNLSGN